REIVPMALDAAHALPGIEYCADAEALAKAIPPPEDPDVRERVHELEGMVDDVEAHHETGKYREGLADGEELLALVAGLEHAPLRARAMYWVARLRGKNGAYA